MVVADPGGGGVRAKSVWVRAPGARLGLATTSISPGASGPRVRTRPLALEPDLVVDPDVWLGAPSVPARPAPPGDPGLDLGCASAAEVSRRRSWRAPSGCAGWPGEIPGRHVVSYRRCHGLSAGPPCEASALPGLVALSTKVGVLGGVMGYRSSCCASARARRTTCVACAAVDLPEIASLIVASVGRSTGARGQHHAGVQTACSRDTA